ncbi:MAG: hypothetical protein IT341_10655 [Chloroflexi bacterium]|nr:hypothetical protein [Chloroflexota bacterium]
MAELPLLLFVTVLVVGAVLMLRHDQRALRRMRRRERPTLNTRGNDD